MYDVFLGGVFAFYWSNIFIMKYEKTSMCETIDRYSARKVRGLSCAVATHEDGHKEYILYDGHGVLYASQSAEAIACHIDMIYLSEKEEK